jgi:hypothetical protein
MPAFKLGNEKLEAVANYMLKLGSDTGDGAATGNDGGEGAGDDGGEGENESQLEG